MALFIGLSGGFRRYSDADLAQLAHRINDPTGYAAPAGGGIFRGSSPAGWTCTQQCRFVCPGDAHSSPAEVDVARSRVRVDRLVVNDFDPPLTAVDMDKIIAGEYVMKMGECFYP